MRLSVAYSATKKKELKKSNSANVQKRYLSCVVYSNRTSISKIEKQNGQKYGDIIDKQQQWTCFTVTQRRRSFI